MSKLAPVILIFFASGVAGLVYEVLWMKQLGLLFGNTAQSVAAVTAAFFIGIAAGSYVWGERLRHIERPLRTYAWLELGIVLAALFYFVVFEAWSLVYPVLFNWFADWPHVLVAAKLLLAVALICPATFLMGGTLPVMGQYLIREASQLSRWSGWLYGINTLGAALGAVAAGFFLIQHLGFLNTYMVALSISFGVAVIAFLLSRNEIRAEEVSASSDEADEGGVSDLQLIAFVSGFASLGLQVLWTRMFVQVLQNSTYTFAAILAIFLLALAVGALIARGITGYVRHGPGVLVVLLMGAGVVVLCVPFVFVEWTDGLRYLAERTTFSAYLSEIFLAVGVMVGLPTVVMGILLPYLYRYAESVAQKPGVIIGRLNAFNTVGAVAGSLVAGFVLLEWLGLWSSLRLMGMLYLLAALLFLLRNETTTRPALTYVTIFALLLPVSLLDPGRLPTVRILAVERDEALLEVWEGSGGTVAVVKSNEHLRIKLNNWYSLGGSGASRMEQMQSHLPISLHPAPASIFYLGLGTGITAGASMQYPVERVTIAELVGDVIAASKKYFGPYTAGLHEDARVRIVNEDGRNYLRATAERYDLVIADLFIPWRSGVGYLYTKEHFEAGKQRLNPGGMFVQWIPLYQVTERELGIIAKSLLEVFPQVTAWRGDFYANKPMMALIGHLEPGPLAPATSIVEASTLALQQFRRNENDQIPVIAHYLGTITSDHPLIEASVLNTDDRPHIEYLAPQSHREVKAGKETWLVGDPLMKFMQGLQQAREPTSDPYLAELDEGMHRAVYAGLLFHIASVAREQDKDSVAKKASEAATSLLQ